VAQGTPCLQLMSGEGSLVGVVSSPVKFG